VPLLFDNPSDYNEIEQGDSIEITHIKKAIENGEKNIKAKNTTKNKEITLKLYLSNRQQKIILAGGLLPFTAQGDVK